MLFPRPLPLSLLTLLAVNLTPTEGLVLPDATTTATPGRSIALSRVPKQRRDIDLQSHRINLEAKYGITKSNTKRDGSGQNL